MRNKSKRGFAKGFEFLGEEDGRFLLELIEHNHQGYLDGFGRFDRTMTFSVEARDDGQLWAEFRQESPIDQVERYYAERGMGVGGEVGMGRSFGVLLPLRIELPNVPNLGRSAYLLDLLPSEISAAFEQLATPEG